MVCEQVSQVHQVPARHVGVLTLELVRDRVAGLTDDLEQALRGTLPYSLGIEPSSPVSDQRSELLGRLEDVRDPQVVGTTQIGTASRRM